MVLHAHTCRAVNLLKLIGAKKFMRLTAGCFDNLNMTIWRILNFTTSHQADNLAKLWQKFLFVIELIAKIFGAVSRTISLMRLSALLARKRCRCRNDGFCSDE